MTIFDFATVAVSFVLGLGVTCLYEQFVAMYGVRRTSSNFWKEADWFNEQYAKQDPIEYGVFDLNRNNNL